MGASRMARLRARRAARKESCSSVGGAPCAATHTRTSASILWMSVPRGIVRTAVDVPCIMLALIRWAHRTSIEAGSTEPAHVSREPGNPPFGVEPKPRSSASHPGTEPPSLIDLETELDEASWARSPEEIDGLHARDT